MTTFPPLKPASLGSDSTSEPDLTDAASTASSPLPLSSADDGALAPMRSDAGDSESVDSSAGTFMQREADLSSLSDMTSDSEAASPRLTSESDVEKPSTKKKTGVGRADEEASESSSDSPASSDGSDYEPRPSNAPL